MISGKQYQQASRSTTRFTRRPLATTIAYSGVSLAAAANSDVFEAKIATRMNVYESHGGTRDVHQYEV